MKIFLLTTLFFIVGCSSTLPLVKSDGSVPYSNESCSTIADWAPPQNAPDDCKKEICINGSLVSVEDLTETTPVYDWTEEKFCLFHPIDCLRAYSIKNREFQWEHDMASKGFWERKSLHNGLGDAARHAYLGCMLTERFSAEFAKGLLGAHEEDSGYLIFSHKGGTGNPCCEKVTDLYNNEIGIMLAGKPGTCEDKVLNSLNLLHYSLCEEEKKESPGSSSSE